ncbi:hypothetical protein CPSG_02838 [Coccidioides posadasii str. Silveira]|uniref:Uncharacterized protein n=1 Tax=Coccidioides posadasii (strain RMSCC 757 / Silveira) TaxID=443226 RepID=E9CYG8_COCPS|nr:hypothetical protein CPSG_02838 [Coccidioides posadasii str. Silveira]
MGWEAAPMKAPSSLSSAKRSPDQHANYGSYGRRGKPKPSRVTKGVATAKATKRVEKRILSHHLLEGTKYTLSSG